MAPLPLAKAHESLSDVTEFLQTPVTLMSPPPLPTPNDEWIACRRYARLSLVQSALGT